MLAQDEGPIKSIAQRCCRAVERARELYVFHREKATMVHHIESGGQYAVERLKEMGFWNKAAT